MKQRSKTLNTNTLTYSYTHEQSAVLLTHSVFVESCSTSSLFNTKTDFLSYAHSQKKKKKKFVMATLLTKSCWNAYLECFFGLLRSCGNKKPQLRRCVAFLGHNAKRRPPIRPLIHPSRLISFIRLLLHTQIITHMPSISMGLYIQKNASWD